MIIVRVTGRYEFPVFKISSLGPDSAFASPMIVVTRGTVNFELEPAKCIGGCAHGSSEVKLPFLNVAGFLDEDGPLVLYVLQSKRSDLYIWRCSISNGFDGSSEVSTCWVERL